MVVYVKQMQEYKQENLKEKEIVDIILRQSFKDVYMDTLCFVTNLPDAEVTLNMLQKHTDRELCIVHKHERKEIVPKQYVDEVDKAHMDIINTFCNTKSGEILYQIRYWQYTIATKENKEKEDEYFIKKVYPSELKNLQEEKKRLTEELAKIEKRIKILKGKLKPEK